MRSLGRELALDALTALALVALALSAWWALDECRRAGLQTLGDCAHHVARPEVHP